MSACDEPTETSEEATSPATAASPAPEAEPEAEAPEAEAAPPNVGRFGAFRFSSNTIAQDGQCFEFGHEDDNTEVYASLRTRLSASAEESGAGAEAVSESRCPMPARVGACEFMHGHINYYSEGSNGLTGESAQAHCTENRGTWVE